MRTLLFLFCLLFSTGIMAQTFTSQGGPTEHLEFDGFVIPTNSSVSGTFKVLYFECQGTGQSTAFYNGLDYIVPSGKTYTPFGVIIHTDGASISGKIGHNNSGVQDDVAFDTGSTALWPDSGPASINRDFYLATAGVQYRLPLMGSQWTIPAGRRPLCFSNVGLYSMKMYGLEQ